VPRTLIVTNDFPPRRGGIQSFVHALATRLPAGTVTVYAPAWEGAAEFDARQPFPVIRHPTSLMLPVPAVARRAVPGGRVDGHRAGGQPGGQRVHERLDAAAAGREVVADDQRAGHRTSV